MNNWFEHLETLLMGRNINKISDLGVAPLFLVLIIALASAFFVSWMYIRFYGGRATGTQIHRAFPLLGLSIAAIFVCIQFSLALSLGLLGALSIIRFRTPIKEPEEVAFIMVVIATSICCATFNFFFLGAVLLVTYISLSLLNRGPQFCAPRSGYGSLVLRLSESDYQAHSTRLAEVLRTYLPKAQMDSMALDGQTCLITYIFPELPQQAFDCLQKEVRALAPGSGLNVFYSRAENLV